jgi:excisionase family DNA binding protein
MGERGKLMRAADTTLPPSMSAELGYTPREMAKLLRVNADRVRGWIRSGELRALNVAMTRCGRPRFVILPHHLSEFESRRAAATPASPAVRRQKRRDFIDFYPD